MVLEWEYTNIKYLRPVSKFKVRFQFRVGQICHSSEKCELCFIGLLFTIFKIIVGKPTKFPFDHRITCLCGIHTALNMIYNRSVMIFSPHPVWFCFLISPAATMCLLNSKKVHIENRNENKLNSLSAFSLVCGSYLIPIYNLLCHDIGLYP